MTLIRQRVNWGVGKDLANWGYTLNLKITNWGIAPDSYVECLLKLLGLPRLTIV